MDAQRDAGPNTALKQGEKSTTATGPSVKSSGKGMEFNVAKKTKKVVAFKCTRPDGTDFRSGTLNYAAALQTGKPVEVLDAAPPEKGPCGHGIHVSPTARKTIQFAERSIRPWRWFEGTVDEEDVVASDENKMRVRRFLPTKELFLPDIFGADFAERIEAVKEEAATWKSIPWLKPKRKATKKQIEAIVAEWREALTPWLRDKTYTLPSGVRIVNSVAAEAEEAAVAAAAEVAEAAAEVPHPPAQRGRCQRSSASP